MSAADNLRIISEALKLSEEFGLTAEVVLSALAEARDNPTATVKECMDYGLNEWIK
jgi:3-hydroxyisobutyrate dehydrogenase-like beta-hydroxyacid dehydrogenase